MTTNERIEAQADAKGLTGDRRAAYLAAKGWTATAPEPEPVAEAPKPKRTPTKTR